MASLPVIKVAAQEGGYVVINECDFDPLVHKHYVSDAAKTNANSTNEGTSDSSESNPATDSQQAITLASNAAVVAATVAATDSPFAIYVSHLIETYTLAELRGRAKDLGLKGLSRSNEQAVAEAIARGEEEVIARAELEELPNA